MKIDDKAVHEFLGSLDTQFRIPIYQRKYSWGDVQCEQLIKDTLKIANDKARKEHFIGSVIQVAFDNSDETLPTGTSVGYVIDGQQRLTTISLIFAALNEIKRRGGIENEFNRYLVNERFKIDKDSLYFKLKLIKEDDAVYRNLLEYGNEPTNADSQLNKNYNKILSILENEDVDTVFKGLSKLRMVTITLDSSDNPQVVFETVNSTGLALNLTDKVRNFVLMSDPDPEKRRLYEQIWHPMELEFGLNKKGEKDLEQFMEYYVTMVTQTKQKKEALYDGIKTYFLSGGRDITIETQQMRNCSKTYIRYLNAREESKGKIDKLLYRIRQTGNDVFVPVILKAFGNLEEKIITEDDLVQILVYLESYIYRRMLVGLQSRAIGDAHLKLLPETGSVHSFKRCLCNLNDKQRFPKDSDLYSDLPLIAFYEEKICRTILDRMEQSKNKDYVHNEKHSIEHIMPQTIRSSSELRADPKIDDTKRKKLDWEKELGVSNWREIHEKYVHTIGNLTLTGYNSEYQNYVFAVKKDMKDSADDGNIYGYSGTSIALSSSLKFLSQWGEKEICDRAKWMIDIIVKIWPSV